MDKRECYVEKSQFRCPHFENGVRGFGELWNCHISQSVGYNLFRTAHFSGKNLLARPIKTLDYKLTHVKSELETTKTLKVEGHLSLDLLLRNITLEGNFLYRNYETEKENVEVINCTYLNECYQIDLMSPVDAIVNGHVLQQIRDKEIEATHVVGGVIVGAMVRALIEIKDKASNSECEASGKGAASFGASGNECQASKKGDASPVAEAAITIKTGAWLKPLIGGFSGALKAKWESNEVNAHLDVSIACKAQPMPENLPAPSSVKELFELIEKLPSAMSKEKHFSMLGHDDITGVPIQFILYPLSHFVNLEIETTYKQLEDDLLNEFQETISKALNIQQQGYIKRRMLEQDSQLKWLLDQKSCLSEKVRESENQFRQVGQRFIKLCREKLKEYKYGRCEPEDLDKLVRDFNISEAGKINEIIENFVDEGRFEILESKAADGSNKISRFTDKVTLEKWLQSGSKIKALLEVKSPCPSAVVRTFLDLANPLTALEIEMGVVMPSISEEAKLHLVFGQRKAYFKDTEMKQALEILHANFFTENQTRAVFYRVLAELHGIKFPVQKNLIRHLDHTLQIFIQVLSDYSRFYVAESTIDFQSYITNLPEDTMAFCVPVDAPETALDFFKDWENNVLQCLEGVEWVVCSFDLEKSQEAPLLMVFFKGKIHSICLDHLDLLIFKHQIKSARNVYVSDVDFSMFSVNELQNSLYTERALYAYRTLSCIAPTTFMSAPEQSDKVSVDPDVEELLTIIRSCLSSDMLLIISTVAQMAVEKFPKLIEALKTCGWNDDSKSFDPNMLFSNQRLELISKLRDWLEIESLVNEIDSAEKLLTDEHNWLLPMEMRLVIRKVADHSHCPVTYKKRLIEMKFSDDLQKHTLQVLRDMRSKTESTGYNSMLFHVAALKSGLSSCKSREQESMKLLTKSVIKDYHGKVKSTIPEYRPTVENCLQNNQLYLLLRSFSIYKYEKWQYVLFDGLRKLLSVEDSTAVAALIRQLSETFREEHTEKLWKNDKWLFLVRIYSVHARDFNIVLLALGEWLQKAVNKNIFPEDIRLKLTGDFRIHKEKEHLSTMGDVKTFLEKIANDHEDTPWDFRDVLMQALKHQPTLELQLLQAGVLVKWNAEMKLFYREWSLDEIRTAISKIDNELKLPQVKAGSAIHTAVHFKLELKVPFPKLYQLKTYSVKPIYPSFQHVMGPNLSMISDAEYLAVRHITDHPHMQQVGAIALLSVIPYIIQQVKLWDGNILKASQISGILTMDTEKENVICQDPFASESTSSTENQGHNIELKQPVNRLDCFAYIINAASCLVAEEILRVLSKFPLALSLIVPDITEKDKYIITLPVLKNLVIRWETNPRFHRMAEKDDPNMAPQGSIEQGRIIENHLFSSPFRMVVAVRLGTNKTGKCQILNQMMAYQTFFSSRAETGDEYGPPCTLPGTVEFTWLTKETCNDWLWTHGLDSHYAEGKDEIVLLANLHGNATQFPETLSYLKDLACCFIVFIMPDCDIQQWNKFQLEVNDKPINCVKVDCGDSKMISTARLTHTDTQEKLRGLIKWALKLKLDKRNSMDANQTEFGRSLHYIQDVKTVESEEAVQLLKSHGCCEIRKCMKDLVQNGYEGWKLSPQLQQLVISIVKIFNCCAGQDLKKAMIHLETELAKKSATESINPRRSLAEAQRKLQLAKLCIKDNSQNDASVEFREAEINERMMEEMRRVNDANLGPEHFFRTFGVIYHIALGQHRSGKCDVLNLPKYYADLVLKGHAVELLNGDTEEIPLDWFRAICKNICEMQPNLRVFVISIIGLQSSGKSTLLNALFSCRFAVSVGRCSRGLYMRMIFLEEDLKTEHGYDAIILIDTEGLASPEKMNDPDASRKDRLLATFAMGLSNLTIVNVLGEELTIMTEILQIVIVTMARLREADVKPDMLVIQHLQERNSSKVDEAKCQFIKAINRAFRLVDKSDVELGATQNACLTELIRGIDDEDMFMQFSAFKDGSSVHAPPSKSYHTDVARLHKILLSRARDSKCILLFERWFQLTDNYWNSLRNEKFALNFKSAQHITDFLYFGQEVAKIKEAVGIAFRFHRDIISKQVSEQGNKLEDIRENIKEEIFTKLEHIPHRCTQKCDSCERFRQKQNAFFDKIKENEWTRDLRRTIDKFIRNKRNSELKVLSQIIDGSILRNGRISELSELVRVELKRELGKKPDGKFSEKDKTEISARIWNAIEEIASSKETGVPLIEEVEKAVQAEYGDIHPGICKNIKERLEEEIFKGQSASGPCLLSLCGEKKLLSEKMRLLLVENVQKFVTDSLTGFNPQCFKVGMKFEAEMIMSIMRNISKMLQNYEEETQIKFQNENKNDLIMYILCEFIKKMKVIQEKWDDQYKPSIILHGKEKVYREEIKTRLEHGFSCAADGYIKASYIIDEVKERARKAAYRCQIQSVLGYVWTTNSEKVRLQYFEELALEVKDGNKERAMTHFEKPQHSIEKWFKEKMETMYSIEKVQQSYEQTLAREIEHILQQIQNSNSSEELDSFLQEYPSSAKGESSGSEVKLQEDFVSYRDSITLKIKSFSIACKSESVSYARVSDDTDVMNRLGCTASCPWCGALCWGSRGHHEAKGEIRKHHSCHQPNGLVGTDVEEKGIPFLECRSCHEIPDNEMVYVQEIENTRVQWGEAKIKYYGTWKFDKHYIEKLDEMMHWFFQELHKDISERPIYKGTLASESLKYSKKINLEDILVAARSVKD